MMYALGIVLFALLMHAIYKYKEIASTGVDPLDEAKLIASIKGSTRHKRDPVMTGGDGQTGISDESVYVQPQPVSPSPAKDNSVIGDQFAVEGESWVADIQFMDELEPGEKRNSDEDEKEFS